MFLRFMRIQPHHMACVEPLMELEEQVLKMFAPPTGYCIEEGRQLVILEIEYWWAGFDRFRISRRDWGSD